MPRRCLSMQLYMIPLSEALLPGQVTAAIVTCGGLCPGLNDVVQNIVCKLLEYGVPVRACCSINRCIIPC